MHPPILKVQRLSKYYPILKGVFKKPAGVVKAVDDVSFSIAKKETLALVGESGSGKSTTARAAIRLIEPTSGQITFLGQDLMALNTAHLKTARLKCQMVFQDPYGSLNPRRSIEQSMGEALLYYGLAASRDELREKVAELLRLVGLSPGLIDRYPHELSGGQQQRVCIGRALSTNPELLICDEALSSLDVSVRAQIINLLLDLQKEKELSYLFISHDLATVQHLADTVAVMHKGRIIETKPTAAIFSEPEADYTKKLLKAIPKLGH